MRIDQLEVVSLIFDLEFNMLIEYDVFDDDDEKIKQKFAEYEDRTYRLCGECRIKCL